MNDAQLVARMAAMMREAFSRPDLHYDPRTMMRDIPGFDSVHFVQMILALEVAFGIELLEDEVDSIYAMGDVFAVLRARLPAGD